MTLQAIANQLLEMENSIVLIYAFNGTGKTQLSVAYKNATKEANEGQHAGVYYNAYSEDLFVWDNDEENEGEDIRLKILPSRLNQFHSFLYEDKQAMEEKLSAYHPKYLFRFNTYDDLERGIESVTFYIDGDEDTSIKISRAEESIFVWCFYLALLDVDGWANKQDAHIFIDDPVSSLDEHNIFATADTIFDQIENHYQKKRIIITTHHIGLFSNLANRLTKGEKSGRYKNLTSVKILKRAGEQVTLEPLKNNVFLYHLHLLQVLDEARKNQLYTYHFALLRQLLESVSSFLGSGRTGYTLSQIGIDNVDSLINIINTHSHKNVYYSQTELMNEAEQRYFNETFERLIEKYNFSY